MRHPEDNRLISGDKRFMKALSQHFPTEFDRLRPCLISFECCVLAVCGRQGFAAVHERLWAGRFCDTTLRHALNSDGKATFVSFTEGLRSGHPL